MRQQQFEQLQSQLIMLTPKQLTALQEQIINKLEISKPPLLTEEEHSLIASLFR